MFQSLLRKLINIHKCVVSIRIFTNSMLAIFRDVCVEFNHTKQHLEEYKPALPCSGNSSQPSLVVQSKCILDRNKTKVKVGV